MAPGYWLPTDAEWEYAAQYDDERIYLLGNEAPDCSRANFYDGYGCIGTTSVVGSYESGKSHLGLCDLAGNVWEWCNDWHTCSLGTVPWDICPRSQCHSGVSGRAWTGTIGARQGRLGLSHDSTRRH